MSRILVLTTSWPRYEGDTAGSFVAHWAGSLAERGHSLVVLCPHAKGYPSTETYKDGAVSVHRIETVAGESLFYKAGAPENLSTDRRAWLGVPFFISRIFIEALRKAQSADIIVGHWTLPMGLIAALVGRICRIPAAAIAHSGDVHLLSSLAAPADQILRRLFHGVKLACVSAHQVDTLRRTLGEPTILPMGVEEELFLPHLAFGHPLPGRRGAGGEVRTILCMGRLVPIKGVDLLLRAAKGLPLSLIIAGDGPERSSLELLARQLALDCTFLGEVRGATRLAAFSRADLFVLSSRVLSNERSEGLPVSLLEAAAAGIPILTSTSGGAKHFFQQDAYFFEANQENSLRDALLRWLSQGAPQMMAARAQQRVEPLRWGEVARRYERFLGLSSSELL